MKVPCRERHRGSAYTLFEIMLVLGIIAVLVGSAIYLLVGNVDVAKEQRGDTDLQAIKTQMKVDEMQNYSFPATFAIKVPSSYDSLITMPSW